MEERKQLSVSDKNGILNELTRKGYTQEVVDLVKEDLDFGRACQLKCVRSLSTKVCKFFISPCF